MGGGGFGPGRPGPEDSGPRGGGSMPPGMGGGMGARNMGELPMYGVGSRVLVITRLLMFCCELFPYSFLIAHAGMDERLLYQF